MAKGKKFDLDDAERKIIRNMAKAGMRDSDIAEIYEISEASLKRKCAKELSQGRAQGKKTLLATAFQTATVSGDKVKPHNVAMNIFLLKVRCGMRENRDDDPPEDKPKEKRKKLSDQTSDPVEAAKIYQKIITEG